MLNLFDVLRYRLKLWRHQLTLNCTRLVIIDDGYAIQRTIIPHCHSYLDLTDISDTSDITGKQRTPRVSWWSDAHSVRRWCVGDFETVQNAQQSLCAWRPPNPHKPLTPQVITDVDSLKLYHKLKDAPK